jgi:hypothetical protein
MNDALVRSRAALADARVAQLAALPPAADGDGDDDVVAERTAREVDAAWRGDVNNAAMATYWKMINAEAARFQPA